MQVNLPAKEWARSSTMFPLNGCLSSVRSQLRQMLSLTLVLMTPVGLAPAIGQQLRIADVYVDAGGRPHLRFLAQSNSYYILYRGTNVGNIAVPVAMSLGTNGQSEIVDAQASPEAVSGFYRLVEVPSGPSLDTDGDLIPDVFEVLHQSVLNPLNPSDADEDPDGDGWNNLQEYWAVTSLTQPDSVVVWLPPATTATHDVLEPT